ncbi:FdhF/YdeP family oxidoreductase [Gimesia aquarii]|uniref:Formate dehydrogenase H n=1 Tax=Gimesia aquarii TaxID=2527964 RepID=A0A517VX91_9PLAN|nr:FdhF/YdeP family oxidoreductase [Gimesia aquarii]QDT97618.1 Formate dehydrogenase H [Gimesia aquarii]
MKAPRSGGGWKAIKYSLKLANRVGWWKLWKSMRSKNACKTCAVGMGGQKGGMVNEAGLFPEVCKKSFQAMASDMQPSVSSEFFAKNTLSQLQSLSSRKLEYSGRLTEPLLLSKGEEHYRPISWDKAIDLVVDRLKAAGADRSFFYASGRSSNEAGFLFQMLSRLMGTNYVNNCSFYCHQASGVGLGSSIGTGAGTIRLEDLDHTDLYILIGANPSSNHPRLMKAFMEIRRRGGKVIVINPVKELGLVNFKVPSDVRSLLFGSSIASMYVQPHIGGDMALLTGIAKEVLEQGVHDSDFIAKHTENFEAFQEQVKNTSWDEVIKHSGVNRQTIKKIADQYISAKNVVIGWCMGITHHLHGTNNVQSIVNVSLLRGMVGRRKAGLMPIRGHSNVQGLGSVGVTPGMKQAMLERFESQLNIKVPTTPGYDTMACMEASHRGEIDFAFCLGGNLFGSNPDTKYALEAMNRIKTVLYLSTTLNTGHVWGTGEETLILPVLPRDEEPQSTTQESMFSYVRMSDGGKSRFEGPRSEVSILAAIGQKLFADDNRIDWKKLESHTAIRELIAELIPGYEGMKETIQSNKEFHVTGRAFEEYQFPTENGKAKFHAIPFPKLPKEENQIRLMTARSEGQFNSVVYDDEDIYRGQERRDVILMNKTDIERLGFKPDQRVTVKSEAGEMQYILVREFDIRAGNALMYYPEANVLVPHTVDPLSKTPGFKSVWITITSEEPAVA